MKALYASEPNVASRSDDGMELRDSSLAWPTEDIEIRAAGDGLEFRGYAAVFNTPSEDLGGFRETILPGAFTRSINSSMHGGRDIRMFLNHNSDIVLASTRAKTLRLSEDNRGLLAEATLPNSSWGQPVAEAIRRGDIASMSFGFTVPKNGDSWTPDNSHRTLHEIRLMEVSPVTGWPAYGATSASVRNLTSAIDWSDIDAAQKVIDSLTDEQREVLTLALNRTLKAPLIAPDVAARIARLKAMESAIG